MAHLNSRHGANNRPRTLQRTVPKTFDCPHCGEAIELDARFRPIAIDILSQPAALSPAQPPQMDTSSRLRHLLDELPTSEIPPPASIAPETPLSVTLPATASLRSRRQFNLRWLYSPATLTLAGAMLFLVCAFGLGVVVYNSTAPKVTPIVNVSLPTRNPTRLAQQNKSLPEDQTQAPVFLPTATTEPTAPGANNVPNVNATAKPTDPDQSTPEVLGPAVNTQKPSDTLGVASTGQGFGVTGAQGNISPTTTTLTPVAALPVTSQAVAKTPLAASPTISATTTITPTSPAPPTAGAGLPNPLDASSNGGLTSALPPHTFAPAPPVLQVNGQAGRIYQAAFSVDGKMIATANTDNSVRLWDATTGKALKTFWGHAGAVYTLSFSPDGQQLASAGADKSIILWDVTSGKQIHRLTGHTGEVNAVSFSPGGQLLASGSKDLTIRLWDVNTGKQVGLAQGHQGPVQSVAFRPDGKQLASGSDDKTIMLWDLNSFSNPVQLAVLKGHNSQVWFVAFSPDGQKLASASLEATNNLKVWDLGAGKELFNLTGHDQPVHSVAFSPDGRYLASGGLDRTVRLWNPSTGDLLGTYTGATGAITSVSFSPDGKLLVGAGEDKVIRLWKVDAS